MSRAAGDVHPGGNPHFLADPHNALAVVKALRKTDPNWTPPERRSTKKMPGIICRLSAKIADWEKPTAADGGRLGS